MLSKPPLGLDRGLRLEQPRGFIPWGATRGYLRRTGQPRPRTGPYWGLCWIEVTCLGGLKFHQIEPASYQRDGLRALELSLFHSGPAELLRLIARLAKHLGKPAFRRKDLAYSIAWRGGHHASGWFVEPLGRRIPEKHVVREFPRRPLTKSERENRLLVEWRFAGVRVRIMKWRGAWDSRDFFVALDASRTRRELLRQSSPRQREAQRS